MTANTIQTGMCPRCRGVQNLLLNVEYRKIKDGNTLKIIEIETAHCECCGSFVSREEHEAERAK